MSLVPRPASPLETSRSNGIVLDALPYVEPLDPHYEQHAVSLIEAELANNNNNNAMEEEHPSLRRRPMPAAASNDVGLKNAPLARSIYRSIVERDGRPAAEAIAEWEHPVPFHDNELADDDIDNNPQTLISQLETSVRSSKIAYEHHRLHHANLELHHALVTPAHYRSYHTLLEEGYVLPQTKLLTEQRITVDGINASRMEEQGAGWKKLQALKRKREGLTVKNERLEGAIEELRREVEGLEKEGGGLDASGGE